MRLFYEYFASVRGREEAQAHLHLENAAEVVIGHAEALRLRGRSDSRQRREGAAAGGCGGRRPRQLQLDAQRVAVDGLVRAAGLPQRIAQVVVGLGEVCLMHQRLPVCRNCLLQLPLLVVDPCAADATLSDVTVTCHWCPLTRNLIDSKGGHQMTDCLAFPNFMRLKYCVFNTAEPASGTQNQ